MQDKEVIVFGRWAMTKIEKVCPKHGEQMYAIGPNQVEVCQACGKESIERDEQKTQLEYWNLEDKRAEAKRLDVLFNSSIVNAELRNATLGNFEATTTRQKEMLFAANRIVDEYCKGATNNVLFLGPAGVGKSHLAYGIIKDVSNRTKKHAMFIKLPELLAKIRNDFGNEERTEQKWIARLSKVPFLVLDDLGQEKISDWSKSILFSILDNRNCTIITSNLESSADIESVYNQAIMDRACKGVDKDHGFKFDGMTSMRRKHF